MSAWKIWEGTSLYFITSTIVDWYPVFTNVSYFNTIIQSLQYCRINKGLRIYAYVVMLDHLHLIVLVDGDSSNLSNVIRDIKRYTSREISNQLKREGKKQSLQIFCQAAGCSHKFKIWQKGFHPKGIFNERFCLEKLNYIHDNPVRKGYVIHPEHWYYSSASCYAGSANVPLQIDNIFEQ